MSHRPYRILHVMTCLPVGGVEHQLLNVIRHYDRARTVPMVCSIEDKGPIGREIEAEGVEVVALNRPGHGFKPSVISAIKEIVLRHEIDIVRTHQYHANFYGRLAAVMAGTKCIAASIHNQYTRDLKPHRRLINHFLAGRTDVLVAVSDSVKTDIVQYDRVAPEKVHVITNGVDTDAASSGSRTRGRAALGISDETFVIGAIGRLTDQKGHVYLVEALASIKDLHPKACVLIVGDGILRESLLARAAELGVEGRVHLAGTRRDIPDMLAAMDIYAMPSLWEGLSNALIEAMAAGRPIVASAIPSFTGMLRDGADALLVAPRDACALADALSRLIASPELAASIGQSARRKSIECYSIKATVERYTTLYEEVLIQKGVR